MHRTLYRTTTVVAVGAIAAITLASCAGGGGSADVDTEFDTDSSAEITFAWWGNDERADRFYAALDLFNEEYPNVEVVRNFNAWGDYWTSRNTEAAGRSLPDVFMMDAGYLGEYADKGLFRDMAPLRDSILPLDGFDEAVLGSGTIDDELVGVPLGTNAWSMMYNKDVLDGLGLEYPTDDMDQDDLKDYIRTVSEAGGSVDPAIYGADDPSGSLPGFIYQRMQTGDDTFDENGGPAFDEQDVIDYLDSMSELRDDGLLYPIDRAVALSPVGGFLSNETALWFNFSTTVAQAMSDTGTENIGLVAPPMAAGSDERVLAGKPSMLLSIAENSEQPAAAAALVEFLATSPEVAEIFGTSLGAPPTEAGREAVPASAASDADLGYLSSVEDQMTESWPILPAGYGTIEAKWTELHEQLRYGQLTTEQFATELFTEMSLVLGS